MKPEEPAHRPNKWSSTYERDTLTFVANMGSSCDGRSHGCCVTAQVSKCLGEVGGKKAFNISDHVEPCQWQTDKQSFSRSR